MSEPFPRLERDGCSSVGVVGVDSGRATGRDGVDAVRQAVPVIGRSAHDLIADRHLPLARDVDDQRIVRDDLGAIRPDNRVTAEAQAVAHQLDATSVADPRDGAIVRLGVDQDLDLAAVALQHLARALSPSPPHEVMVSSANRPPTIARAQIIGAPKSLSVSRGTVRATFARAANPANQSAHDSAGADVAADRGVCGVTTRFHASRRTGGVGRQGFDPDMLLGLLLYAYAVGERSSRRIERLCVDHVAFRVLCGSDAPDHTTIARFRAEHQDAFAEVFAQVLRLCAAAGMVKVGVISIDGTKIAANAARGANRSPDAVREEARRIAQQILEEAAVTDIAEDRAAAARGGGSDDDLPPGFASRSGRATNLKKALAELDREDGEHAEADAADRSRAEEFLARVEAGEVLRGVPPAGVDPVRYHRARIARLERLLADLAGVRGAVASRRRREATRRSPRHRTRWPRRARTPPPADSTCAAPAARARDRREHRARTRGGTGPGVNVTDPDSRLMTHGAGGGSVQGYNAQLAVTDDHLILGVHLSQHANDTHCYTPTLAAAATQAVALGKDLELVLADAGYFTADNLTAPGPDRLIAPGKNRDIFTSTDPDAPAPPGDADPLAAMRHRLKDPANAAAYKRRSATVEPVIAHLKDRVGLRRFARRGLQAATAELHLAAAALNLNRLHHAALTTP